MNSSKASQQKPLFPTFSRLAGGALAFLAAFALLVRATTLQPAPVQAESVVCPATAPKLKPGQKLKILTYNVQYMAGRGYVFFYDLPNNAGPDERPSAERIGQTLESLAQLLKLENPDLIFLQEVDDGAKRTDYQDQLALLLTKLPAEYACYTTAFYWKAAFVPHPRIRGAVGMKLATISKYQISKATRYQLPLIPADLLTQQFNLKRAILAAQMPVENAQDFVALNTHFDAFAQGTKTMAEQVAFTDKLLERLTNEGSPWIIGGDFNLLPPGKAVSRLLPVQQAEYNSQTEITPLFDHYQAVPNLTDLNGPDHQRWFTHFANNPQVTAPSKTIDYFFLAKKLSITNAFVRQHDTLKISDHFPVIVELTLPAAP